LNAEGKWLAGIDDGDGGRGLAGLENLVLVMFEKDRECRWTGGRGYQTDVLAL